MKPIYALVANLKKKNALSVARKVLLFLKKKRCAVWVEQELSENLKLKGIPCASQAEILRKSDLLIALGGDGTILNLVRAMRHRTLPVFGVNLGGLGFLTEVKEKNLTQALEELVAKRYVVEKRMRLEAHVRREGRVLAQFQALNDVVVTNGAKARVIYLEVFIGSEFVSSYMLDGIIVATPTGSTAYSLSSGGPIVHPDAKVMAMTPICPHTLTNRPIVISEDKIVKIQVGNPGEDVMVTIDGQIGLELKVNDLVEVKKSLQPAKLISLGKFSYFNILREKLNWGAMSTLKKSK